MPEARSETGFKNKTATVEYSTYCADSDDEAVQDSFFCCMPYSVFQFILCSSAVDAVDSVCRAMWSRIGVGAYSSM